MHGLRYFLPLLKSYSYTALTIRRWPKFVRSPNSVGMVPLKEVFDINNVSNFMRENNSGLNLFCENPLNDKVKVRKFARL